MLVQNNSYPFDKRIHKETLSLKKNSYEIYVICPLSGQDKEKYIETDGVKIFRYKGYTSNGSFMGFIREFLISFTKIYFLSIFLIVKEKVNIIHVANPPDFFWPLALICKVLNVKFIYDQHDLAPELFNTKFKNKFFYKFLLFSKNFQSYFLTVL